MDWLTATLVGACGGIIATLIDLGGAARSWQEDRHRARVKHRPLPAFALYIDILPDVLVFATRLGLGALAGLIFHSQVNTVAAALAVGASAPGIFRQMGSFRRAGDVLDEEPNADFDLTDENDSEPIAAGGDAIETAANPDSATQPATTSMAAEEQ